MTSKVDGNAPSDPRPPRREPCLSCCSSHFTELRPGPRLGPSSSCLARNHQDSGRYVFTRQLWVGALFGATGLVLSGSIPFCTLPPGSSVSDGADHRGVDGQLCAVKERQTIRGTTSRRRAPASLQIRAAQLSNGYPRRPQNPRSGATSPVVATRIEWLATPASCGTQGELAPGDAEEVPLGGGVTIALDDQNN